ncbi:bifunctional diguanylate cyclase/phosphodiesterase [Hyphomicrobium sp.]|uniref:bifunctional diguanylate cyclase/phosphodiesterase n=1 Tax=Hyphomicrobium sp. TaxID=82 RepID=UPI0025BCB6F3|nr:bifunctional diguanylate cyclase/phosphodiesterase [Hyphomicrobium sp.]MCC7253010.1 bifunctional diguanylate cyclase/phosphodiesterase [Hyphomicrobium sp.]
MPDREPASLNRIRLFEALGAVLRRAERTGRPSALLMASVNTLGAINTRLGIDVGDALIAETGRLIKSSLSGSDTIGRYGSNTFAIIVDNCGAASLRQTAESMIELIRNATIATSAGPLAASISVGGVILPEHAATATDAIRNALGALELAKQQPSGVFVAYDPNAAAERALEREKAISSSVMEALNEGRMLLMLQPVVTAAGRRLAFYEGLLRLSRRDGTLISAADFIEEAEQLGLARLVDRRSLELGIALLKEHPQLKLSINISSLTAGDEDWIATLQSLTEGRPDVRARLIVEMTETAMVHDFDAAAAFLDRLRDLGCKVGIDDFGAGYTSFRHLRALNVDMLKIDGSFVAHLASDPQARVLVKSMIEMAKGLGLETVAEWVADEEGAAFLEAAGATYLQGYLYGPPMAVDELNKKGLL